MNVLIFKTELETKIKVKTVMSIFDPHPCIIDWSIDTEDIDNVLRIEVFNTLKENDIITMMKTNGFYCEILPD